MKICPKCQKKYFDTDYYCLKCRYPLEFIEGTEIKDRDAYMQQVYKDHHSKDSQKSIPKCPICGSEKVSKISSMKRLFSVQFWGLASDKIGKQWHCSSCNSNF